MSRETHTCWYGLCTLLSSQEQRAGDTDGADVYLFSQRQCRMGYMMGE